MKSDRLIWLIIILILIIIIITLICWLQYRILFYPMRDMNWVPPYPYEDVYIPINRNKDNGIKGEKLENNGERDRMSEDKLNISEGEYINAWYFKEANNRETVLFCHGNSGNISHREYMINLCRNVGVNLLLFDYRGYGNSPGSPSQKSICEDGETSY